VVAGATVEGTVDAAAIEDFVALSGDEFDPHAATHAPTNSVEITCRHMCSEWPRWRGGASHLVDPRVQLVARDRVDDQSLHVSPPRIESERTGRSRPLRGGDLRAHAARLPLMARRRKHDHECRTRASSWQIWTR